MFGHYTYLLYVLFFCLVPTGVFWALGFRTLRRNLRVVALSTLILFIYLCATDPLAEAWRNWYFTSDRLLGLYMLNFPVEEGLFFLLVPFAVASAALYFLSLSPQAVAASSLPAADNR